MKKDLFIELAVEEIPSAMAPEIARGLSEGFENRLRELNVGLKKTVCLHTPRRFSLMIEGLEPRGKDTLVESFGPAEAAAFNPDGSPTKAAIGFARSKGVKVEDLETAQRERGRFLVFRRKTKGEDSGRIIARETPAIIAAVRCAKSMRWNGQSAVFARPIRKISCFYGGKPLKIEAPGIPFSNTVSGHRFAGGKPFKPAGWKPYLQFLRKNFVIADPEERRTLIEKEVARECKKLGGVFRRDDELLDTVCGLVEHPLVLSGNFEKKFLELPQEVLTSVMKNHQKYFPVFSTSGGLMPHFVFVCGTPVKDASAVIKGNERVLRARFVDAEFFHTEDLKKPLRDRTGELESMIFLSGLGTYGDKTARLEKIAAELALKTGKKTLVNKLKKSARLSKADLATQMVFEIPELQGVMGGHYASKQGEDKDVVAAIEEHYMPTARDSEIPATDAGALLAIADKIDNICGCFYLGMKPSGSSDPLALRRQAIGLIRTALDKNLDFSLAGLIDFTLNLLKKASYSAAPVTDIKQVGAEARDFIAERFRSVMAHEAKADSLEAVISAGFDGVTDCGRRLAALEGARKSKSFMTLVASFKRVVNILKDGTDGKVNPKLFENDEEKTLWKAVEKIEKTPVKSGYEAHLKLIGSLSKPVDAFFEGVMVMHSNKRIRKNRIALLGHIKDLFFKVGDLSKLDSSKD
ncbi:MAG: glycine--tRNA ligase subunit beta [Candidatus Mycalebacterium zealandia]|nr:MAG: glycine--tRNA ligase subunit beta [Candidatus Mycalebacterium zealandia]